VYNWIGPLLAAALCDVELAGAEMNKVKLMTRATRRGAGYPATVGPGVNGFAGQLPAGPRLPR
jgi:hypothetical protein